MTHKTRRVRVEEYAYYVNKLHQNVGLETSIRRQIVTSETERTQIINGHHMPLNENAPGKVSAHATAKYSCLLARAFYGSLSQSLMSFVPTLL